MKSPSRSGVFSQQADPKIEAFTESIRFDVRLFRQDIRASQAHARMLQLQQLITEDECQQLVSELQSIEAEIAEGKMEMRPELEDIHMHIEALLIERLGDVGRKLHTARSRNDQVSTDLRLWVRESIDGLIELLREMQSALVGRCPQDLDIILPAYTHLQRAQPVRAAHYWLAYCEKFERDISRLEDCRRRANVCPLGTAAVAGTSLPIDRRPVAEALGFERPTRNSLDSSNDRDFAVEFAFVLSVIGTHLSGMAEEWILWATTEFGFLSLPDAYCTGSSIMPQKVNPDVLELVRGKSAATIGNLQGLLTLTKGLPLAYNRDLQEDKPMLFTAYDHVHGCCSVLAPCIRDMELNQHRIQQRIEHGYLDATTFMEYLIQRGVPQRAAHETTGTVVREAMKTDRPLSDFSVEEFQQLGAPVDATVYKILGAQGAVDAFVSEGSTARDQILQQIAAWNKKLGIDS